MDERYARIMQLAAAIPWAIEPEKARAILAFLVFKSGGGVLSQAEIAAAIGAADQAPRQEAAGGAVAVLRIRGVIAHHIEQVDDISGPGGTAVERFRARFREALADPNVEALVLDVDSPGGLVNGVDEMAAEIFKARGDKLIVAVANTLAASAAYWLVASADEIVVTPSGEVGSIGVFSAHTEFSKMEELKGVKTTLVHAGKFKVEGNPFEPIGEEALAYLQSRVDDYYQAFTQAVAKGRGVKVADVRNGFGQGRLVGARQAVTDGLADRVGTLEQTILGLAKPSRKGRGRAGAASLTDDFDFLPPSP